MGLKAFLGRNPLLSSSVVMFVGAAIASSANYLYHLLMGRMLGPSAYGELESVIAILYLLIIVSATLTLVTAKFVADLKVKDDLRGIKYVFSYFTPRLILWGGAICFFLVLLSPQISSFLHLKTVTPFILGSLYFFVSLPLAFNRGVLQGMLKFKEMATSNIYENGLKLVAAVILVLAGFRINGAITSLFLGGLMAWMFTLLILGSLRKFLSRKPELSRKKFFSFAIPVLINNLSFTSLYTTDVILVKHFFNPHDAGLYAALAVLGKIVFFASSPIAAVMFPMVINHKSQNRNYRYLLFTSFLLVFLICLGAGLVYTVFPRPMMGLMFGSQYLSASPLVPWMGIFISIYSLAFLVANFFLSVDKTRIIALPFFAGLLQIALIVFFHQSLFQVIIISLLVSGLLLTALVLFYWYNDFNLSKK